MKKTINISLAGTPFSIEEDAYQTLDAYLAEIRSHFSNIPDSGEIIADIEARIAEQFLEKEKKIITTSEIDAIIASMGSVQDFNNDEGMNQPVAEKKESERKHLYRNPEDKVIAGVASGIASYLGVDTVWVRLVFILLVFADGFGILLYFAFWIAMPEAKSASQKLEMSGTPVTIENLVERVKERVDEVKKDPGTLARITAFPLLIIRGIVTFISEKIFPFLEKCIGFIIGFIAVLAIIIITIVFGVVATHLGTEYMYFPVQESLSPWILVFTALSGYITILIPLIGLLLFGNMLSNRKSPISGITTLAILGIWFSAIISSVIAGAFVVSETSSFMEKNPLYRIETRTDKTLSPFSKISAKNGVHVIYLQSATTSVSLTGRAKDISTISVLSKNGVLRIEPAQKKEGTFCIFCSVSSPNVIVTAPSVTEFRGENGVNFEGRAISSDSKISILLSNGSRGIFEVQANDIFADMQNGIYFELIGTSTQATINGENVVKIDASEFSTNQAEIRMTNASSVEIGPTRILKASAKNGSSIYYSGSPEITKDEQSGSTIENRNE